jgi:glutaminyl-peptide cyclotransferase
MPKRRPLIRAVLAVAMLAAATPSFSHPPRSPGRAASAKAEAVPVETVEIVRTLPHDPNAFTQGLFFHDGHLFESTGREGRSWIREVDLETGRVLRQQSIARVYFGEGSTDWGDSIVSLTWQHGLGFRWNLADFTEIGTFQYSGEGWGLTHDQHSLILSDGTPALRFLDPTSFAETRRVRVTAAGRPIDEINELEYVHGDVLANIWQTDRIARIDPQTGRVKAWIDCSALVRKVNLSDPDAVLNGIAWDARTDKLYLTGKDWPVLFEVKIVPARKQ